MQILLLLLLAGTLAAQQCGQELRVFASCKASAHDDHDNDDHGNRDGNRAAKSACFTNNGCLDPEVAEQRERQCVRSVMEGTVAARISSCVAQSGIYVPAELLRGRHGGGGGRGGRGGGQDKIAQACYNDPTRQSRVQTCLGGLVQGRRQSNRGGDSNGRRNRGGGDAGQSNRQPTRGNNGRQTGGSWNRGTNNAQCQLSGECKSVLESAKAAACSCGQRLSGDAALSRALSRCGGDASLSEILGGECGGGNGSRDSRRQGNGGERGRGQRQRGNRNQSTTQPRRNRGGNN